MTGSAPITIDTLQRPPEGSELSAEAYARHYLDSFERGLESHLQQWRQKAPELRHWFERWVLDGWLKLDQEALLACVTEDFVCEDPALVGTVCHGREAYREFLADTVTAFPDSRFHPTDPPLLALDGTQLIVPWRATGHFTGPLRLPGSRRALAPTGAPFDFCGVDLYSFRGERICRLRSIYDGVAVLRQLGIVPGIDPLLHRLAPVVQPLWAVLQRGGRP